MEQRSAEWYEFRKNHIGASDVSAILGLSRFKTELDLFMEKTGQEKQSATTSFAAQRGIDAESKIKALYEAKYNVVLSSPTLEYPVWPVLSASLDGLAHGIIQEFKYPNKAYHNMARRGKVPPEYMPQCQAQLLVTGCKLLHYCSFDGLDIEIVTVKPNKRMQTMILDRSMAFWKRVEDYKLKMDLTGGRLEWLK